MQQAYVRITEVDSRKLQALVEGALLRDRRDTSSVEQLERHLLEAEVVPASRIGREVVTMNSEALVTDLDTGETFSFRVVFPRTADAAAGKDLGASAPRHGRAGARSGRGGHLARAGGHPPAASRRCPVSARKGRQGPVGGAAHNDWMGGRRERALGRGARRRRRYPGRGHHARAGR